MTTFMRVYKSTWLLVAFLLDSSFTYGKIITLPTLDFETAATGAATSVSTAFGSLRITGFLSNSPDPDLGAAAGRVLENAAPGFHGDVGEIKVIGGLATSIKFRYGGRLNDPPNGGFRGWTYSQGGLAQNPQVPGELFYRFATNQGESTGPVTLPSAPSYFNSFQWTTRGPQFDVNIHVTPGQAQIDDVMLAVEPAVDILRNPKSLQVVPSGRSINAYFKPHGALGPVRLDDLAAALEVDRFNWIQRVDVPSYWTAERLDNVSIGSGVATWSSSQLLPGVFLDPVTAPQSLYRFTNLLNGEKMFWETGLTNSQLPVPDQKDFYLNDDGTFGVLGRVDDLGAHTTSAYELKFYDAPTQLHTMFQSPDHGVSFETILVGVKRDGTYTDWGGTSPRFKWKSTATHDANQAPVHGGVKVGYSYVPEGFALPPLTNGGITNVEVQYGENGDFNDDRVVNASDLVTWQSAFGQSIAADGDHDDDSDGEDFLVWQRQFGMNRSPSALMLVPEPAMGMAALVAGLGIFVRTAKRDDRRSMDQRIQSPTNLPRS